MSSFQDYPAVEATVSFYPNVRKSPPFGAHYRPHLLPTGSRNYLGVLFEDIPVQALGNEITLKIRLIYDTDYTELTPGATFSIIEGKTAVGDGTVLRWFGGA